MLATPRLLAWAEATTCAAVADELEASSTSVGTRVTLDHRAASAVGEELRVTASLTHRDGRLLRFEVVAVDSAEAVVGYGEVTRVVVDRERFLGRLRIPVRDLYTPAEAGFFAGPLQDAADSALVRLDADGQILVRDGGDEERSLCDVLPEGVDALDGEPVLQSAEERDGEQGASDAALAALEGAAAECGRGDGLEFEPLAAGHGLP